MLRLSLLGSAALCGLVLSLQPAFAQSARFEPVATGSVGQRGDYGGGFIELLMTGRDPGRAARAGAVYQRPAAPAEERYGRDLYGADPLETRGGHPAMAGRERYAAVTATAPAYERPIERVLDPRYLRQEVAYGGPHAAGTIIIDTPNRFLYLVQSGGRALRYGIGVGRPGFTWAGVKHVSRKSEWPDWTPPPEMLKRRPDLPRHMEGGPENPLGARALYLGSSLYRIHGTNEPNTIGQAVSSGCIRMVNDDVVDLYGRVRVGTKVIVM